MRIISFDEFRAKVRQWTPVSFLRDEPSEVLGHLDKLLKPFSLEIVTFENITQGFRIEKRRK